MQDGHNKAPFPFSALAWPSVGTGCSRSAAFEVKNAHRAVPNRLAANLFKHRHRLNKCSYAAVL
jgi:hypothetical protein